MLDQIRSAVDGIPVAIVAFATPPALWAKAAWASPFLRTYRHGISGMLSIIAGALMAASVWGDEATFPIFLIGAAITLAAMFYALLWPPAGRPPKRTIH
jgi:hypothetical protein